MTDWTPEAVAEGRCPGCGDEISPRYQHLGVCQDCYGTMDDPAYRLRIALDRQEIP